MESRTFSSSTRKAPAKNFRGNPGDRKKIKTDDSTFRSKQNFSELENGDSETKQYSEFSYRHKDQSSFYQSPNKRGFRKGPSNYGRGGSHQNRVSYPKSTQFYGPSVNHSKNAYHEQPDSNPGSNSSCGYSSYKNSDKHSRSNLQGRHCDQTTHSSSQHQEAQSLPKNQILQTYHMDESDAPIKPPQIQSDVPVLSESMVNEPKNLAAEVYRKISLPSPPEIKTHNVERHYPLHRTETYNGQNHCSLQSETESYERYLNRKDHDIGEGRYLRDLKDLPPRFKRLCEKAVNDEVQRMQEECDKKILMMMQQCKGSEVSGICEVPGKSDDNKQNATSEYIQPPFQPNKMAKEFCVSSELKNVVDQCIERPHDFINIQSHNAVTAVPGKGSRSPQNSSNNPLVKTQTDEGHQTVLSDRKIFQSQKGSKDQRTFRYNNVEHPYAKERVDANVNKVLNSKQPEWQNKPSRNVSKWDNREPLPSSHKFSSQSHIYDAQQYSTPHTDCQLKGGSRTSSSRICAEESSRKRNLVSSSDRNVQHFNCKTSPHEDAAKSDKSTFSCQDVRIQQQGDCGITSNRQDCHKSQFQNVHSRQKSYARMSSEKDPRHLDFVSSSDELAAQDTRPISIRRDVGMHLKNIKENTWCQPGSSSSECLNKANSHRSTGQREVADETSGFDAKDHNFQSACTEAASQYSFFSDDQLSVSSDHSTNNRKAMKNLVKVEVSRDVQKLDYWQRFFEKTFPQLNFEIRVDCDTNNMLSIAFSDQSDAKTAWHTLKEVKGRNEGGNPFIKRVKFPRYNYYRNSKNSIIKILRGCLSDIEQLYARAVGTHERKIDAVKQELDIAKRNDKDSAWVIQENLKELEEIQRVFFMYTEAKKKEMKSEAEKHDTDYSVVFKNILQMKKDFIREYNCFKASLPIYAKKEAILDLVVQNQVSVLVAETGSGKSTQLVQYLLQNVSGKDGLIVCTQPRKIAAVSIAEYISGQMGSPVGSVVGYEVGLDKKMSTKTKIVYMTDHVLLKKCVKNRNLEGISCVVIDEAHERSLLTDLLLAIIKKCLPIRPDIRIIITSATINPKVFKDYFSLSSNAVLSVPGRVFPVEIKWQEADAFVGWNFLTGCVQLACKVHEESGDGDILVFLTSPQETDEAITLCRQSFTESGKNLPMLFSLHGKQDRDEQMKIFSPTPKGCRKIVFATNAAETSITIPGIKYVIDSGMVKERQYIAEKNRNALVVGFISKSSAEQRKGRAGRTQAGVCYRLYSKKNYDKDMPDRILPEILRINLQLALMRILEFKIQPEDFDFVESPSKDSITSALHSLEFLGAVKNKCFTDLGKKIIKLPLEPQLGKLVIIGAEENVGFEVSVIAAVATVSGMVFYRNEDNRGTADKKKIRFCKEEGDFLTFLDLFKEWYRTPQELKSKWCADNCINAKALRIAQNTSEELIQTLRCELQMKVYKTFKPPGVLRSKYENILFDCFSENICVFSGHKKTGYLSPFETGSFFIHPSSSLCYLNSEYHNFVIFSSVLKTSRSFLLNVTPISESTIISAYQREAFPYQIDMLKHLQIAPARIYPVGESILIREILGRQGFKLHEIEQQIKLYAKTDAFHIDVKVEKGEILVYIENSHHAIVTKLLNSVIQETLCQMDKEEEIFRIADCASSCVAVSSGGIVNDILLPGEFREVIVEGYQKFPSMNQVILKLKDFGALQSYKEIEEHGSPQILATYVKACDAQTAVEHLQKMKLFDISSKVSYAKLSDKSLPLFRLQVTWPRFPCLGTGWVSFHTVTDCIEASGILTNKSFYIGDHYIVFTPAKGSEKVLQMKNLPPYVEIHDVMHALKEHLPDYLKVKSADLVRQKWYKASEKEMNSIKKQLFQMFGQYTPSSKLVINLRGPNVSEVQWTSLVYFENFEDGEQALKCLTGKDKDKAKIGEHKLQIKPVLKSSLHCCVRIFELVKKNLHFLMSYSRKEGICTEFDIKPATSKDTVLITFSCNDIKNLNKVRQEVQKLVRGSTLPDPAQDPVLFSRIFSKSGEEYLKSVEKTTQTVINLNSFRKTVTIYGLKEGVSLAKTQISCYISSSCDEQVKEFKLCGKKIPSGFLKALRQKFGFQLNGLIQKFNLRAADINFAKRMLTVKCSEKAMRQVEQCLAELCVEVKKSISVNKSSDQETCPVCLDVITSDLFRLNHCGHAFCRECLLLQIESKIIPLLCSKEGCEKPLFVEDINKLLSGNEELKKEFSQAALKNFIAKSKSVRYCPMPDCSMVYRVRTTGSTDFHCPSCENDICTRCHAFYHHGMTCEMFQKVKVDEHYSVKVWMEEDPVNRKQCTRCSSAIEKVDGCNHVHCTSCDTHLCWLCLGTFTTGQQVYDHIPFCEFSE